MKRLITLAVKLQTILKDNHGQDLIEYALMAGFVAVAAGALLPRVAQKNNTLFFEVGPFSPPPPKHSSHIRVATSPPHILPQPNRPTETPLASPTPASSPQPAR